MTNFSGQVALITGGASGIGLATASLLHQGGAKVILVGSNAEKLEKAHKTLTGSQIVVCNLQTHYQDLVDFINLLDKLDIIVNNAGITRDKLTLRMTANDWQEVMQLNLFVPFILSQAGSKIMMKQHYGRIINISSIIASTGNAGQINYAASKGGLESFTKSLALELAKRKITVNCVAPGFIDTNMTDKLEEASKAAILTKIPMQRFGEVNDVAAAVAFLASKQSSFITGQTLHVNGGMYMN